MRGYPRSYHMEKNIILQRCIEKRNELLDKYFGLVKEENARIHPETLEEKYTIETPFDAEDEFFAFLEELNREVNLSNAKPLSELIDRPLKRDLLNEEYQPAIENAYRKAREVTLREKILHTNHKDVAYFKGLLKQYTEELLEHLMNDFLELGDTV